MKQAKKQVKIKNQINFHSKNFAKSDNIDEMIVTYQKVIERTPSNSIDLAHQKLGEVLIKSSIRIGETAQVVTFFKDLAKAKSNSPWLYYNLGSVLTQENQIDEAISCYQKSLLIQPNFWQAFVALAQIFMKQGNRDTAFQHSLKAFQTNPNLPRNYYGCCQPSSPEELFLFRETFLKLCDQTENLHKKSHYYYYLGKKLGEYERYSEATVYYQKCIYYKLRESHPEFVSQHWDTAKLQDPNFLIIGVAKCATTTLYDYLTQHPQVLPAPEKELRYLRTLVSKAKKIEQQGDWSLLDDEKNFYLAHFPPRPEDNSFIVGEATPAIIGYKVELLVKKWFPKIKLIVILRNPVKRAISHYNYSVRKMKMPFNDFINHELDFLEGIQDFDQAMEDTSIHLKYILGRGLYLYPLKRWMKLFPKEQFLILRSESLAENPDEVMKQTFDFLGLSEYSGNQQYIPRKVGNYPKNIDIDLLNRLKSFYQPHNKRLEEFLGNNFNWNE